MNEEVSGAVEALLDQVGQETEPKALFDAANLRGQVAIVEKNERTTGEVGRGSHRRRLPQRAPNHLLEYFCRAQREEVRRVVARDHDVVGLEGEALDEALPVALQRRPHDLAMKGKRHAASG